MAKEMTVEEAVRIITETYEFGEDFDTAVSVLKEKDPQNSVLNSFRDEEAQHKVKKARAKAYAQMAVTDDMYDEKLDEALALLRDDKTFQQQVADEQEIYDKENHIDMSDEDAVLRNAARIGAMADSFEDNEKNAADFAALQDKVDVVDDDSGEVISAEEAQKYWNSLLQSAKEQAIMLRSGDLNFFMKKDEEKRQTLDRDIKDFLAISVAKGVAGTAMDEPNEKEVVAGSADYDKYIRRQADKAEQALDTLFSDGRKAKVKTGFFLNEAVETSRKMSSYAHRWFQKGFKRVADAFTKRRESFDEKMKGFFGKAYAVKHALVENVKNNKWRMVTDTVATGVVAASAATGVLALPAVAGYALYTAAGSWAWPLVEKKTKAIREAKKAGKDAGEWTGFKGLKKAYAEIKADGKEYKKYKTRAVTGTAFGIAGAGVVAGMGAASGWAADKAGYLTARVASSVIRSTGSLTSQGLNWYNTKKDFKEDPSAENRAKLKQAKIGFGLGAVIAVAGNWIGFGHLAEANAAENSEDVVTNMTEGQSGTAADSTAVAHGNAAAGHTASGNGAAEAQAVETAAAVTAPESWNASMGISEKHWNEMQEKLTGIYENHSAIFDKENVASEDAWDGMYQNLENARAANPKYFGNMTNEQVLYKYMKLIESTERATTGPSGYLVTKLDSNGLPTYGSKEMTETMRALNDVIICGKKVKISAERMNGVLDYVDERRGAYMGPGADIGMTNNRYAGGRAVCGEDYQNAWKRVRRIVSHHRPHIETKPEPILEQPVVEQPAPKPVAVEEVVTNEAPAAQKVPVSEEVVNQKPAQQEIIINEGATDGDLDVNSENVRGHSRNFVVSRGGNSGR
ncbi:MAG: hypothetical protein Q4D80_06375 [Pseudomonadota bacterium]|nr:hypothetical protein [Pseudomonadota bacterium]